MDVGKHLAVPSAPRLLESDTRGRAWLTGPTVDLSGIRNGVDAQGHWLPIMTYTNVNHLSDADIEALIAYLRSRRPSARKPESPDRSPVGSDDVGPDLLPSGTRVYRAVKAPGK